MVDLLKLLDAVNGGQLVTTGGFIAFVLWLYFTERKNLRNVVAEKNKERDAAIDERKEIEAKYVALLKQQNVDLTSMITDYNEALHTMNTAITIFNERNHNHD